MGHAAVREIERRRRELEAQVRVLRAAVDGHRQLLGRSPIAHLSVDANARIAEANAAATVLLGAAVGRLSGSVLDGWIDEGDRPLFAAMLRGDAVGPRKLRLTEDAGATHALTECVPLGDALEDAGRVLVTMVDPSRYRGTESLRSVLEHVGYGVLRVDAGCCVREVDGVVERILRRSASELVGRPLEEVFERVPLDLLRGGTAHWEGRARDGDGALIELDVGVGGLTDGGVTLILRDVTEQRAVERELRRAQKLDAAGRLSAGIAHDMNNLLMAIVGSAERAARRADDPAQVRARLDEIRSVAEGGAAVVRRLTAFAGDRAARAQVALDAVIRDVAGMLRPLLGEDVELAVVLDAADSFTPCDAGRLEQVLVNLAVNARDAMPGGGRLEITTSRVREGTLRVVVRDTGRGIDPALLDRVLEPFFTTKESGTGIGLAVVRSIVEECGGRIEVDSELGLGTAVAVELPEVGATTPSTPPPAPASRHAPKTVLVVDDDPLVRSAARAFLERGAHRVIEAASSAAALARCDEAAVDVVLADVVMRGDGGAALAEAIRRVHPDTRVLLMSGYPQEELVRRGRVARDAFILAKPCTERELLAAVDVVSASVESPRAAAPGRARVLLVEDEPHIREALAELLADEGFTVHAAPTLAAARELQLRVRADVLLTDGHLEDGRGADLAAELAADEPDLGVVLLSARPDEVDLEGLPRHRAVSLRKPAGTDEVIAAIERVRAPAP